MLALSLGSLCGLDQDPCSTFLHYIFVLVLDIQLSYQT